MEWDAREDILEWKLNLNAFTVTFILLCAHEQFIISATEKAIKGHTHTNSFFISLHKCIDDNVVFHEQNGNAFSAKSTAYLLSHRVYTWHSPLLRRF